jgi:hypothetical protein
MDSRIPGIDVRYKISRIDRQYSSDIRTAELRFPGIWIGAWDSATLLTGLYSFFLASVAVIVVMILTLNKVHIIVRFDYGKIKTVTEPAEDQGTGLITDHAKKVTHSPPRALHHIMVRGIDRQVIFRDQKDY